LRLNIGLPGPFSISMPVRMPSLGCVGWFFAWPFLLIWYMFLAGVYLIALVGLVLVYAVMFSFMLIFRIVSAIGSRSL
jgi:hypothetical protein